MAGFGISGVGLLVLPPESQLGLRNFYSHHINNID
jgi:hypothetical protein